MHRDFLSSRKRVAEWLAAGPVCPSVHRVAPARKRHAAESRSHRLRLTVPTSEPALSHCGLFLRDSSSRHGDVSSSGNSPTGESYTSGVQLR